MTVTEAVEESRITTEDVTSDSDALAGECDELMQRINTAYDAATTAQTVEQTTFDDATNMLDIMANFASIEAGNHHHLIIHHLIDVLTMSYAQLYHAMHNSWWSQ